MGRFYRLGRGVTQRWAYFIQIKKGGGGGIHRWVYFIRMEGGNTKVGRFYPTKWEGGGNSNVDRFYLAGEGGN